MKLYVFLMLFTVLSWFPRVKKTDHVFIMPLDFPSGASGKELSRQCRRQKRQGFDPWVGKILWRRKQQPTPVFLPGESHGQRSLKGYSPWGHKELDTTKRLRSSIMPLIIFNVFLQSNVLEIYFLVYYNIISSSLYCCCSVCPTPWDPMDCSPPGFPVLYHILEISQAHVHWADDAIQPSHLLSSPSPSAFSLSQHQGLFQWVSSSHQVAKVLEFQLQHQFFQWINFMVYFL